MFDALILDKLLIKFEEYLANKGYSKLTPSGLPSTTYNYSHIRIPFILKNEKIDVFDLLHNIDYYIALYDIGGEKEKLGNKSNRSVINALKRFKEFNDYMKSVINK